MKIGVWIAAVIIICYGVFAGLVIDYRLHNPLVGFITIMIFSILAAGAIIGSRVKDVEP